MAAYVFPGALMRRGDEMKFGTNDLLKEAYRNLGRESALVDSIVTVACLIAIVLMVVYL
jgi:hypothetical protein